LVIRVTLEFRPTKHERGPVKLLHNEVLQQLYVLVVVFEGHTDVVEHPKLIIEIPFP